MRKYLLLLPAVMLMSYSSVSAQETVNPAGRPVTIRYALNRSSLPLNDTLIITRTVVNKATYALTNLYLSDNLPTQFQVVAVSARVNGVAVTAGSVGPTVGAMVSGYNGYWWVLDSPVNGESWNRSLNPNDSLSLQIKIVSSATGNYSLPFHSTVCYGNGSGIFSTATASSVSITTAIDTTPPAAIMDLGDVVEYQPYRVLLRCSAAGWATDSREIVG